MAAYGTEVLEKWNQALNEVSNIHEYINDDGSVEKWSSNEDVQTLKAQIEKDIESGKKELIEVIEKRNAAYELLKDKNYELVQPL
jgi:FKBP-type peptidyl-prolyl cis-trans isomerase (trigger factor)